MHHRRADRHYDSQTGGGEIYIFLIADCNIQCKSRDIVIFVKKNLCMNPHSVKDAT